MTDSTVQGTTDAKPVSTLQQARRFYQAQPLSTLDAANAGTQQVVAQVQSDVQTILNDLGVEGNPTPTTTTNPSVTAAVVNTNANITQTTNASGTTPTTATGITAGSPIANANANTVHVCDICGPIGVGVAQARMAIMQALKSARDQILQALGLSDAEAQAKAVKNAIQMAQKTIKAIKTFIETIQNYLQELEKLIQALEQGLEAMIKAGLDNLIKQFQKCLSDAKSSYAAGLAQQQSASSSTTTTPTAKA